MTSQTWKEPLAADSAPTTSRDMLDSTGRAYARGVLGLRDSDDLDVKKSVDSVKKSVDFKSEKTAKSIDR